MDLRFGFAPHIGGDLVDMRLENVDLRLCRNKRNHDLRHDRLAGLFRNRVDGFEDRAHLHLVDFRIRNAEAAAAMPQHGIHLVKLERAGADVLHLHL